MKDTSITKMESLLKEAVVTDRSDYPFLFSDLGDKFLKSQRRDPRDRSNLIVYPSELGDCLRKTYWRRTLLKNEFSMKAIKAMYGGDLAQDYYLDMIARHFQGDVFERVKIEEPFTHVELHEDQLIIFRGRIDQLVTLQDGTKVVVEVKSTGKVWDDDPKKLAKVSHLMQIILYMHVVGADLGYIVYIDRGTLDIYDVLVFYYEEAWKAIKERAYQIVKHLEDRVIPIAEAKKEKSMKWQCMYRSKGIDYKCPFYEECDKIGDEERPDNS